MGLLAHGAAYPLNILQSHNAFTLKINYIIFDAVQEYPNSRTNI
ncbi:hypothetical protein N752_26130 [Desulforamulus aquiferis]|nr:hypothetical protein N752_26130 [Desulforamulus aquiferis]